MPTTTEVPVKAFAHCSDARCSGYHQERVEAFRVVTEHKYTDNGGDLPFVEKSFEHLRFGDSDDQACKSCGRARELSAGQRKSYANQSGHDPMGLLGIPSHPQGVVPASSGTDEKVAALEAKIAALMEKLEKS